MGWQGIGHVVACGRLSLHFAGRVLHEIRSAPDWAKVLAVVAATMLVSEGHEWIDLLGVCPLWLHKERSYHARRSSAGAERLVLVRWHAQCGEARAPTYVGTARAAAAFYGLYGVHAELSTHRQLSHCAR